MHHIEAPGLDEFTRREVAGLCDMPHWRLGCEVSEAQGNQEYGVKAAKARKYFEEEAVVSCVRCF